MTPALLAAVRKRDEQETRNRETEIWPDMAAGVITFFAMDTQWRRDLTGAVIGLDYSALQPCAQLLEINLDQRAFHDIRIMESETLRVIRSKRRG